MANAKYRIELRQIEVRGLNARHYFWVRTRVDADQSQMDPSQHERTTILGELHGFPKDPETGQFRGFSMGGDNLQMFDPDSERYYDSSRSLPRMIAFEGTKAQVDARWSAGRASGIL